MGPRVALACVVAALALVLATTTALMIWIVLWAIGIKSIDAFLVAITIIILAATVRVIKPYLPGRT